MTVAHDPDPKLAAYAHPDRLVTTAWLAEHMLEARRFQIRHSLRILVSFAWQQADWIQAVFLSSWISSWIMSLFIWLSIQMSLI